MNIEQLKEAIRFLNKKGFANGVISENIGITIGHLSKMLNDKKTITDKFVSALKKEYGNLIPTELFEEEIYITKTSGEVFEELIKLRAWITVVEAQLIAWAPKMKEDPEQLTLRLKSAQALEVDRIFSESSRTKK